MPKAKSKSTTRGHMKTLHISGRSTSIKGYVTSHNSKVNATIGQVSYAIPKSMATKLQKQLDPYMVNVLELPPRNSIILSKVREEIFGERSSGSVNLRGLRYREDLTQIEFAKAIGITQANLSAMENGSRPIGKDIAKRIAEHFEVDYRIFL